MLSTMSASQYLNLIVTLTNIAAIVPIDYAYKNGLYLDMILLFCVMCASMLHHISGINRGLDGIMFLSYANELLWLDRIVAFLSISRILYLVYKHNIYNKSNSYDHMLISVALFCLFYSDVILQNNNTFSKQFRYCLTHSLWHISAFICAKQVLFYTMIK